MSIYYTKGGDKWNISSSNTGCIGVIAGGNHTITADTMGELIKKIEHVSLQPLPGCVKCSRDDAPLYAVKIDPKAANDFGAIVEAYCEKQGIDYLMTDVDDLMDAEMIIVDFIFYNKDKTPFFFWIELGAVKPSPKNRELHVGADNVQWMIEHIRPFHWYVATSSDGRTVRNRSRELLIKKMEAK